MANRNSTKNNPARTNLNVCFFESLILLKVLNPDFPNAIYTVSATSPQESSSDDGGSGQIR